MVLAPDLMLGLTIGDFLIVRRAVSLYNENRRDHRGDQWTMVDGFYANTGGFVLDDRMKIGVKDILLLVRQGFIALQSSYAEVIRDKSKADSLSKFITCAQALWLVAQCIARGIEHLPISTLELGTDGYVFITCAIYGFNWHKPKDVKTPISIPLLHGKSYRDAESMLKTLHYTRSGQGTRWEKPSLEDTFSYSFTGLACAVYDAWHCIAWNNYFPTQTKQLLWRITAVMSATPFFIYAFTMFILGRIEFANSRLAGIGFAILGSFPAVAGVLLYIFARGYLFIEMFLVLRRMPAGILTR
ncbi:hypothetical protein OBBRIDRAFT_830252 [Obba rivulosa]|uniref:Uncharacterized protein n=1 Tax=Obba rivulosa TaxID=1052685 RepID=A0A8E2J891_9APHY|nr:hypothetical protein OBBRIDRAFT_830252 [Obba rivulosa]